jgi:ectoine hydroxylase-related dioxygenase (phytanoyl-CoA dioxygenase family)
MNTPLSDDAATQSAEARYFAGVSDLRSHVAQIESPDLWRRLNPHLTISETPFAGRKIDYEFSARDIDRARLQICEDGYLQTGPGVPAEECRALSMALERIIEARYHPMFLAVYDEYWRVMQRIAPALTPILGEHYRVLGDFWIWCISQQTAAAGWRPHRDHQFRKRLTFREDRRPLIVTVWIPLTDATPLNGCMYLLPMSSDPNIPLRLNSFELSNLQNIRALPAQAGSVLAWNQYVMHWGGAASQWADHPRMSMGIYVQAGDVPLFTEKPVDFAQELPFARRLALISSNLLLYQSEHRFPPELVEIALHAVKALPGWESMVPDNVL